MADLSYRPLQLECPDCEAPVVLYARLERGARPGHHEDAETFASPTTTAESLREWLGKFPRFSTFVGFVVRMHDVEGFQVLKFERPTTAFDVLQYTGGSDHLAPVVCRLRLVERVEEDE